MLHPAVLLIGILLGSQSLLGQSPGSSIAIPWSSVDDALKAVSQSYFRNGSVLFVPSSHQDIAWMGSIQQCTDKRDEKVITPALELLEKDPNYRISFEATYMLDEYLARHPDRKEEIAQFVKEGRLGWGATYNEPYEGLFSGESLIRELYFGRKMVQADLSWSGHCFRLESRCARPLDAIPANFE